ncbi:hypothetical protein [Dawidia soli]|uniref:HEAT repeat domain-containing protein n=1 Tax=Dawidia soli TaxID=2782352 RepID=A0AAP2GK64_9BACT|nr:hypothetical protein [Dawidia soli]MBT1688703.1 hypothetical protein [Dawidia soli]
MTRVFFVLTLMLTCWSVDAQSLRKAMDGYFDMVRSGKSTRIPSDILQAKKTEEVLALLPAYAADTMPVVRAQAYGVAKAVGLEAASTSLRQKAVRLLVAGCRDAHKGNVGMAIRALTEFDRSSYSDDAKDSLVSLFHRKPAHIDKYMLLLGYLELTTVRNDLREIAQQKDYARKDRWAALLALARMGDSFATNDILRRVQKLPVTDDVVYEIFPDLIYTRQQAVLNVLLDALKSDARNCASADAEQDTRIPCGYRIMEQLAPAIQDYPLKLDASGDIQTTDYGVALQTARDWFAKHPDYKILKDRY